MSDARPILLCAGGTGGHLFPAEAVAHALAARGFAIELATDSRALKYGASFPARRTHAVAAATPTGGSLASKALAALTLGRGVLQARSLIRGVKPLAVVGFGGYPTVPPLLAASQLRAPTLLHEQNAVMGRANRFLAKRVTMIATGFKDVGGVAPADRAKLRFTGNPLRPAVIAAAGLAYPDAGGGILRIAVTGGSQGARIMSEIVPAAIELLDAGERARLRLVQQARAEDKAAVEATYARLGVAAEVAGFFADLPARIAGAHLVIARAGASTVSELAAIGRACILVPFPHALDQDQAANAAELARTGAASVIVQTDFSPQRLAAELRAALADPAGLANRARAAREAAAMDAAERLAALVAELAGNRLERIHEPAA